MVGAVRRRVGLGLAATALVLALTAGAGCGSPAARHTPQHGQMRAQAAAEEPKLAAITLPGVRGGLPWPVTLRTAGGMYVIARSGTIHWLGPDLQRTRAPAGHPAGFVWVNPAGGIWATMRRGHLVIMRDRTVIWQSKERYRVQDAAHMGTILTGRPGIAFEVGQLTK